MSPTDTLALLEKMGLLRDEPPNREAWQEVLQRLHAERSLEHHSRKHSQDRRRLDRALVREAPVVTFTLSVEDGSISSLNPAFEELTGWPGAVWQDRPMTTLAHPEDRPTLVAGIHQVTLGETPSPFEIRLKTRSKTFITAEWVLKPLLESGRVTAVLGFAYDVSRRKMAERDLSAAKDAAESANQAKGEFLANMSHEIRTPMNAIVAMTSLLLDTELNQDQRSFTETLKASCHTLLDLVDDILDFSKIESGKLELEKQPFDLRRTVADATYMVSSQAGENGLSLTFGFSEMCPEALEGDVVRVRQVLVNLLSNAVKFTEQGSVKVWVDAEPLGTGSFRLRFEVQDTGCGIALEQQEKIFDAFSQAQASTSRRYGGTGLGLSISRRLTELMGGRIGVESHLGGGSIFYFTILARAARLPIRGEISEEFDAHLSIKHPLEILVADDNPTNQQVAKLLLARRGYRVDVVGDGHEALRALEKRRYDLVLMDVLMPNMDGLKATREIHRLVEKRFRPQVVAMTASAMQGDREQCLDAGMVDFLTKPINEEELESILILCSERARGNKAPPIEATTDRPRDPDPSTSRATKSASSLPDHPEAEPLDDPEAEALDDPILTPLIEQLYRDRPERVIPLIKSFLDHTVEAIKDLDRLIRKNQAQSVREVAHSLKGSCQMLGAKRMGVVCANLESLAKSGQLEGAVELLDRLDNELIPVSAKLGRFLTDDQNERIGGNRA